MKTASITDLQANFGSVLKGTGEGPVVITRNGRPVAVLVGVEDEAEVERILIAQSPKLHKILAKSTRELSAGKAIPHDEFWEEFKPERRSPRNGKS